MWIIVLFDAGNGEFDEVIGPFNSHAEASAFIKTHDIDPLNTDVRQLTRPEGWRWK